MLENRIAYFEDRDQAIFIERQEGKRYKEIAPMFGLTISGVKQALRRHRDRLNNSRGRNHANTKPTAFRVPTSE